MNIFRALSVGASAMVLGLAMLSAPANAAIVYKFTGSGLDISLTYADFVTETGMKPLGASYATPFGYDVNFAGTNTLGWWGFDDDNAAVIDNFGYAFEGNSFLFQPSANVSDYIRTAGTYQGRIFGNPNIGGAVVLTVSDTSVDAPEPAALGLLGLGVLGLAAARRRRA